MTHTIEVKAQVPYQMKGFVADVKGEVPYMPGSLEQAIEGSLNAHGKYLDKPKGLDFNAISEDSFGDSNGAVIIDRNFKVDDDEKHSNSSPEYPLIRYQRCINPNIFKSGNDTETQHQNLLTFMSDITPTSKIGEEYLIVREQSDYRLPFEIVIGCKRQQNNSVDFKVYTRNYPMEEGISKEYRLQNILYKKGMSDADIKAIVEEDEKNSTGMYFINAFKAYLGNNKQTRGHSGLWESQLKNGILGYEDIINYLGGMSNKFILKNREKDSNKLTSLNVVDLITKYTLKQK